MEHTIEEGECMCLISAPWWSYWSNYAGLTKEDVLRVPERLALGLDKTVGYLDQAPAGEPIVTVGAKGGNTSATAGGAVVISKDADGNAISGAGGSSGNGQAHRGAHATENIGKIGKESAVPSMLARRPHEIDNSGLQVRSTEDNTVARPLVFCVRSKGESEIMWAFSACVLCWRRGESGRIQY